MRKILLILLLMPFAVMAQYPSPLPSSGTLSISTIKQWMYAAGEITLAERDGEYSMAYLNAKSHLADKTAPYSINDWYGYYQNKVTLTKSIAPPDGTNEWPRLTIMSEIPTPVDINITVWTNCGPEYVKMFTYTLLAGTVQDTRIIANCNIDSVSGSAPGWVVVIN